MGKMGKLIDLTGKTYGRLTVLERAENKGKQTAWLCRCECGNLHVVTAGSLRKGNTKSCGCLSREKARENNTTHGMSNSPVYSTWCHMLARCENPKNKFFNNYGGRGIKVCERWHDINNFYADVSILEHFGEEGYSLDRIDVNGDYCLENVRWATAREQANNRRTNIKVVFDCEEMTLAEVAEKTGLPYSVLTKHKKRFSKTLDELLEHISQEELEPYYEQAKRMVELYESIFGN